MSAMRSIIDVEVNSSMSYSRTRVNHVRTTLPVSDQTLSGAEYEAVLSYADNWQKTIGLSQFSSCYSHSLSVDPTTTLGGAVYRRRWRLGATIKAANWVVVFNNAWQERRRVVGDTLSRDLSQLAGTHWPLLGVWPAGQLWSWSPNDVVCDNSKLLLSLRNNDSWCVMLSRLTDAAAAAALRRAEIIITSLWWHHSMFHFLT